MKLYQKYLLSYLIKYFLLILFSITAILSITKITKYIEYITEYGLSVKNFLKIITLMIPEILIITIPITLIISTIFVLNKLTINNELIILQNFSISKFDILKPLILLNIITIILSYYITFSLEQKINIEKNKLKTLMQQDITNLILTSKSFNNLKNIVFYSKKNTDLTNKINNFIIFIAPQTENENQKLIYSQQATINNNIFLLKNGNVQEYNKKNRNKITMSFFEDYVIDINKYYPITPEIQSNNLDFMNIFQLLKYSKNITNKNIQIKNEILGEINRRFYTPLIGLILSLFSAILMIRTNFSRLGNSRVVTQVYIFSTTLLAYLFYNIKLCFHGIKFIILFKSTFLILTIILVYLIFKKEYV